MGKWLRDTASPAWDRTSLQMAPSQHGSAITMDEVAHVRDQGPAQTGVASVPGWLPPLCLWPNAATSAAT